MKWDVKHDRAKKVLNHFLDNAGYWTETESLTEGLTEDEIQEVSTEVATMIQSITKRYKLDVMLPAEPVVKEEPVSEEKVEELVAEEPAEEVKEGNRGKTNRRGKSVEALREIFETTGSEHQQGYSDRHDVSVGNDFRSRKLPGQKEGKAGSGMG